MVVVIQMLSVRMMEVPMKLFVLVKLDTRILVLSRVSTVLVRSLMSILEETSSPFFLTILQIVVLFRMVDVMSMPIVHMMPQQMLSNAHVKQDMCRIQLEQLLLVSVRDQQWR